MKNYYTLLALLSSIIIYGQTQLGNSINGEFTSDQSGHSVSISGDGNTIAIGAERNDANGTSSGHVRIYENTNGVWSKIGNDIDGGLVNERLGWSVSLSDNGNIVAIGSVGSASFTGHVSIYENINGTWTQIGNNIVGEAIDNNFGISVSLSANGNIVAIGGERNDGANGAKSGHVRIYENNNGTWSQIGSDIDGEAASNSFGFSVSLSSDGTVVAAGATQNSTNGSTSGHVRVYENNNGTWTQIGGNINGEAANDRSGYSVSLSSDGTIVAIGALFNDGNGSNSGHVRVYENISGVWTQIGDDIDGDATGDVFGASVSLSSDGRILAVGAPIANNSRGYVNMYERINNPSGSTPAQIWTQIGNSVLGEAQGDSSGTSVSISSDGSRVAIGAIGNDVNGNNSGHVRIYDFSTVLSTDSFNQDFFTIVTNNQLNQLEINLNNTQQLKQVNLYAINGKYLYSSNQTIIDTSSLSSGVYIVELITKKGKSAKKVVIN